MAKRHVNNYYRKLLKQYNDMQDTLAELQKCYENGEVAEEQVTQFIPQLNAMKDSIESLSYIIFLLNAPATKFGLSRYKKDHRELYTHFVNEKQDEESIYDRNNTLLDDIKTFIEKECKKDEGVH